MRFKEDFTGHNVNK